MAVKQTAGRDALGEFAPKFAELNDEVLFGQVWSREDKLSLRDRSLVTVVALMAQGLTDSSFRYHLTAAKNNGITRTEIAEILTHAAFYAGWPKAWAAFRMAKEVWAEDAAEDAKAQHQSEMVFPIGAPNDGFAQYFSGKSYLAPLSTAQAGIYNVTFEPGCRNNWHIHHAAKGGGQILAQAAVAQVNGVSSLNSAHFAYQREETVVAAASGTVSELCVREGSTVRQDDVLLRITGKDLDKQAQNAADNLRSAELRMSSAERNISHYTIDAPISGTIVDKKVKAGDKLSANDTAMQNLCTIYDMSYLEMKLNVDELKIRSLKVGQEVEITADAVPGETYKGVISSILVAGTTANGSTSYPVTVRIDDMGELLPGMNATAKITTASVKNVLALPNAALVRGSYVLVTKDSPSAANAETSMTAPDGYVYVKVTTGISDDDYIEVKSGLQEGDTIAYDNSSVSATDFYSNMMASAEGDDE